MLTMNKAFATRSIFSKTIARFASSETSWSPTIWLQQTLPSSHSPPPDPFSDQESNKALILGNNNIFKAISWEPLEERLHLQHPSAPILVGWVSPSRQDESASSILQQKMAKVHIEESLEKKQDKVDQGKTMKLMNRNARRGKRANRGKRPVSRARRRAKKRALGNHRR